MICDELIDLKYIAARYQEEICELRHRLHEIPELGWKEELTLDFIRREIYESLAGAKVDVQVHEKIGGIWVDINVGPAAKRLLFRADIDGLPIQEETELPFSSLHDGKMHACGHDCHSAMLLTALRIITTGEVTPVNNLRLVWQRAEEIALIQSGGGKLVEEGVCEGITAAYALHVSASTPPGVFMSVPGQMMCNAAHLQMEIECSGGHVARPNYGSNAIDILTDIHVALRGFELRDLGPNEIISFVPSISRAGTASNIRPGRAEIAYAVRNFLSPERLQNFMQSIKRRVEAITSSYPQASLASFELSPGHPRLDNDVENFHWVKHQIEELGFETEKGNVIFAGEDFAYYLQQVPGSYWCLGAMQEPAWDHHTSRFNPDESILWKGVAFWLKLATAQEHKTSDKI